MPAVRGPRSSGKSGLSDHGEILSSRPSLTDEKTGPQGGCLAQADRASAIFSFLPCSSFSTQLRPSWVSASCSLPPTHTHTHRYPQLNYQETPGAVTAGVLTQLLEVPMEFRDVTVCGQDQTSRCPPGSGAKPKCFPAYVQPPRMPRGNKSPWTSSHLPLPRPSCPRHKLSSVLAHYNHREVDT